MSCAVCTTQQQDMCYIIIRGCATTTYLLQFSVPQLCLELYATITGFIYNFTAYTFYFSFLP